MIKAYILDLNGVLIMGENIKKRISDNWNITSEETDEMFNTWLAEATSKKDLDLHIFFKPYLDKWGIPMTTGEFFQWWFGSDVLAENIIDWLKKAKSNGIKLFILSNTPKEGVEIYRRNHGELFSLIDMDYYAYTCGYVKPDKRAFEYILNENNLKPEEVIFIDDFKPNSAEAELMGIKSYISINDIKS